jgi:hypothetical protein
MPNFKLTGTLLRASNGQSGRIANHCLLTIHREQRESTELLCTVETDRHAPREEVAVLRPATAAISLSMPPKIQRCTG